MDYSLLLNQTYLWLLEKGFSEINFSRIGDAIGLNRKTIAKQFEEMKEAGVVTEEEILNIFDIHQFYSEEDNKYARAIKILKDIAPYTARNIDSAAKALKVSSKTLYNYFLACKEKEAEEKCFAAVYSISRKDTGEVVYIGYTTNFAQRKNQHLSNLRGKSTGIKLYNCDFTDTDVIIEPVLISEDLSQLKILETNLIRLLKPIGNNI